MTPAEIIYVIDDDASVRKSVARLLRSVGYRVDALPSAEAFLQKKSPDRAACLILDLRMPGLDGLELQKSLTHDDRKIPIVFLSGQGDVPTSVQAMKGGAVDFLTKPFQTQEFLNTVERAIKMGRRLRKEHSARRSTQSRVDRLTPREREVLEFVVAGRLNKQIALRLGISEKTVKVHRGRVMEKMRADSLADLVRHTETAGIHPSR